jgi:hypothetical protein
MHEVTVRFLLITICQGRVLISLFGVAGKTRFKGKEPLSMALPDLASDFVRVLKAVFPERERAPSLLLVGHSMVCLCGSRCVLPEALKSKTGRPSCRRGVCAYSTRGCTCHWLCCARCSRRSASLCHMGRAVSETRQVRHSRPFRACLRSYRLNQKVSTQCKMQ